MLPDKKVHQYLLSCSFVCFLPRRGYNLVAEYIRQHNKPLFSIDIHIATIGTDLQ